jgi:putative phosphoesterase
MPESRLVIGLISDTHGLLRPEATAALAGSDYIIHAGDIGDISILERLKAIAPVTAVRGNIDKGSWASGIPKTEVLHAGDALFFVIHALEDLDRDPAAAGFHAVVSGHSHRPSVETRNGVLFINPGSAGPRRFHLPISLARVSARGTVLEPRLLDLTNGCSK